LLRTARAGRFGLAFGFVLVITRRLESLATLHWKAISENLAYSV